MLASPAAAPSLFAVNRNSVRSTTRRMSVTGISPAAKRWIAPHTMLAMISPKSFA